MTTKLTLSLDQVIIEKAKEYAKTKGSSLSNIIENYLKLVIEEKLDPKESIAPITKSLKGSFHEPNNFDYKKQLTSILAEKYQKLNG